MSIFQMFLGVILLAIFSSPACAEYVDGNRIIVIDGDTVALPCANPTLGCAEKIRLLDVDAPETFHPDCEEGRRVGLQAKARVVELIRGSQVWIERGGQHDRYGRTLAALRVSDPAGLNIGQQLLREKLALLWRPGQDAKAERRLFWCGPD